MVWFHTISANGLGLSPGFSTFTSQPVEQVFQQLYPVTVSIVANCNGSSSAATETTKNDVKFNNPSKI